jgi:hypothetical protein
VILGFTGGAMAQGGGLSLDVGLGLQMEAARQPEAAAQPAAAPEQQPDATTPAPAEKPERIGFGHAGSSFISVGLGYMNDFSDDQAGELYVGYSHFIADELEFILELGAWYFDQDGDNTGAVSPVMNLRWHFLHDEAYDWSVFGEAGFGLLFAFDNVPDGGTGFDFLPRLGAGFTKALDDDGTRLVMGVRWQHISNGRIEGDARNPGRDSLMVWAGVMFPF